ncbi:YrdB family protein [bacterium]|nr:YrdB family protein [bacterium]
MVRFFLEIAALVTVGMWGWRQSDNWIKYVMAIGLPFLMAILWGVFAVPNDPSRTGNTIVNTPGVVRLILELAFFAFATSAFYSMDYKITARVFGTIVFIH